MGDRCRLGRLVGAVTVALALALTAPPAPAQDAVPVVVVGVRQAESALPLRLTGTVTAERVAALSPRVSGLVVRADADAGHVARRGEVLVILDTTLAELALASAWASLDEARAELADAARLREEAHALGQNIPQSTLLSRGAQVTMQTAVVARLEAEVKYQTELVARHTVVAPFDGVVAAKLTEIGEWAESGTPVLELVGTDRLRLDVQVPQEHYPAMAGTTSAVIRIDAFPEEVFTGRIAARVPLGDPDARTFLVRILLDDPAHEIIAGMSAEADFSLPGDHAAIEIPRDAVIRYPDGTTSVWVVEAGADGSRAHERRVSLGTSFGDTVEVIDGLAGDARIVVRGNETLEDGAAVRAVDRLPSRDNADESPG
ncbi:MAG: efflux RND transporter periplasmic adaptor subunit [Alphaproteobacteria bacterium]|jgi:RND family efflux transporter MFP subunit|nr:efflux RND transporter periplasmic adaptor subunit [Alphaproteobacteria bacterium]MDP6515459.1 efflux RND transporter periplasmic adaptor subunit [Alphaproteobacteria bacterium]